MAHQDKELEQLDTLTSVIYTLNLIEVKGKENLNRLLACIQALEDFKAALETEVKKNATENK